MNRFSKLALLIALLLILIAVVSAQVFIQRERRRCEVEIGDVRGALAEAQNQLRDWPQLERYAEANAGLPNPLPEEARVVFIGDSITEAWPIGKAGGFFEGKPYVNRGISAQITQQMLARFRQDVVLLAPRVVVINGGTNDFTKGGTETTLDNLASMAELASFHKIRVVLASILPVSNYGRGADGQPVNRTQQRPPSKIVELNSRIKAYAEAQGFTYLDYYSAMIDERGMLRAEFADDGLHPNARGYAVMSPLAEQAINSALNSKL